METIAILAQDDVKRKIKECFAHLLLLAEAENEWHLPYLVRDIGPHAVILDATHPARDAEKIVEELSKIDPDVPIVAITSCSAKRPVALLEKGVYNTISFPCSQEELIWLIQQALEVYTLRKLTPKVKVRPQETFPAALYH